MCLSINNDHLVQHDHSGRKHDQPLVSSVGLLVAWREFAEPVEPRMTEFHDPAARLERGIFGFVIDFLAARADMWHVAGLSRRLGLASVSGIQAKVLFLALAAGLGDLGRQQILQFDTIIAIGRADDDCQRDAMLVDQQMTLAPIFFPGPSGWDRPTPGPAGL